MSFYVRGGMKDGSGEALDSHLAQIRPIASLRFTVSQHFVNLNVRRPNGRLPRKAFAWKKRMNSLRRDGCPPFQVPRPNMRAFPKLVELGWEQHNLVDSTLVMHHFHFSGMGEDRLSLHPK